MNSPERKWIKEIAIHYKAYHKKEKPLGDPFRD